MIHAYAVKEVGGQLESFEYDPGKLGVYEVEIDVLYCGVCHSDISMIDNEWGMSEYPLVPGHEVVGKIAEVGEGVVDLKVGQAVGLGWHAGYCGHCGCCNSGDENLCSEGIPTIMNRGGFADKVRASERAVVAIPEGVDLAKAGPLFCGGITVFNPLVQFDVKPTARVGVVGIGGLGHMALQFLNAWGCEVTAFTSSEKKREEAFELGAHATLNSRDDAELKAASGSFDLILTTVNVKLDWNRYLQTLAPKGRLHFVGATLEPLDVSAMQLIGQQRQISGSPVGSPGTIAQMLEFAKLHKIEPVVEEFPMEQINKALDHLREGKAHYRIVLKK
ncbi:NAD(P)-dependent alcohol dehydrogenase [Rubritalea spongiae]|uniref:NAD(P)-dependent alcohol dehydrogenase n=1 Tax=Rubritalea spongiae TaxID=430797 RepID=A0ABW5E090_9BACT